MAGCVWDEGDSLEEEGGGEVVLFFVEVVGS